MYMYVCVCIYIYIFPDHAEWAKPHARQTSIKHGEDLSLPSQRPTAKS